MKVTIVVPTIREESIKKFLTLWGKEFRGHRVIIVEDNPTKTFLLPDWVEHYSWKEIDKELGKKSWIIPRRTDCIRSFGYLKAYKGKPDFIITLDDDCYPEKYQQSFLQLIEINLSKWWKNDKWWNTLEQFYPRGFPYNLNILPTVLSHGLWSNIPDLDAKTQKAIPYYRTKPSKKVEKVPHGQFFPMCGMNLAFKPEAVPALYFLLMGKDYKYDRFGDIWAGIFFKKIVDHLGYAIISGAPSVHHSKASNVDVNLKKETPGYPVNEILWQKVDKINLTGKTFKQCYIEIAKKLDMKGKYWDKVKEAMIIWTSLF